MVRDLPFEILKNFLINIIEKIILDNNGGIKMKDLLCQITSKIYEKGYDLPEHLLSIVDDIIEKHSSFKILHYSTHVTNKNKTEKFIYLSI